MEAAKTTAVPFSYYYAQESVVQGPHLRFSCNMDQAGRRLPHPADFPSVNKCPTPDPF